MRTSILSASFLFAGLAASALPATASSDSSLSTRSSSSSSVSTNTTDYSTKGASTDSLVSYPVTLGGLNLLAASAKEVADALDEGKFTSVGLVEAYLARIAANDKSGLELRSIIETAPRDNVLAIAQKLDDERKAGKKRSALHGIPIAVKDNYNTHPELGMNTTAGSYALLGQTTVGDAFVVEKLRDAGVIILAKANLNEFAGEFGRTNSSGWSARGLQTSSAYVPGGFAAGGDPGGSSGGSAVSTSAGFVTFALGSDTEGSILDPSNKNGLYGFRPSTGLTSRTGVVPISSSQDTTGPIGKSTWDLAAALSIMAASSDPADRLSAAADPFRESNYTKYLSPDGLKGLRIGVPRQTHWNETYTGLPDYLMKEMNATLDALREAGATVIDPVLFDDAEQLRYTFPAGPLPVNSATRRILTDFKADMADYLSTQLVNSTITSLFDIIRFNDLNADLEFPPSLPDQLGQSTIVGAWAMQHPNESVEYWQAQYDLQRVYLEQILPAYDSYGLDLLVAPSEADPTRIGTIGMMPCGTVPVAQRPNGAPYGLTFVGRRYAEGTVLRAMSGWEATQGARPVPSTLD
ncbi:hypothetical protein JCM8547_001831 [Rhodosporidiobolus lusitaniae]